MGTKTEQLDLLSIIKTSHIISGQIKLNKLISNLMNIVIEQAGVEKGYLLLECNNKLVLSSQSKNVNNEIITEVFKTLEEPKRGLLSTSILNEAKASKQIVEVEDDTYGTKYGNDNYIVHNKPKYIVCFPIIIETELIGILYLENTNAGDAFSFEKLKSLEVLVSQSAISLVNSLLIKDLFTSRRLLQDTLNNSPAIIFIKDPDGKYQFINQEYEKLINKSQNEVLGKTDYDLWPKEFAEKFVKADREIFETGKLKVFEESAITTDGKIHNYITNKFPLIDPVGKIYGTGGIATDITDIKQTDKELKHSLSLLETTLESTADGILILDREGKITGYNQKFIDLWEIPSPLIHSMNDKLIIDFMSSQLKDPEKFLYQVKEIKSSLDLDTKDILEFHKGKILNGISKAQILDHNIIGRVWSFSDITESIRLEKENNKRLEQLSKFQKAILQLTEIEIELPFDEKVDQIIKIIANTLNVERVSFWYYDENRLFISTKKIYILSEDKYRSGLSFQLKDFPEYFKAFDHSTSLIADDAFNDERISGFKDFYLRPNGISSMMDVSVRVGGKIVGYLCNEHCGVPRKWSFEEEIFASSVAGVINLAMEHEERRKANDNIKLSEEKYRFLSEVIPHHIFSALPNGEVDYCNSVVLNYYRKPFESLKGWGWASYVHPEDIGFVKARWNEALNTGIPIDIEFRILRHDGAYRWFLFRAGAHKDDSGNIIKWFGSATDISDLKEIEEKLKITNLEIRKSEKEIRFLTDAVPDIFWTSDPEGNIDYVNKKSLEYTGLSFEEINGWLWQKLVHPNDREFTLYLWKEHLRSGKKVQVQYRFLRKDGMYRWHLARAIPQKDKSGRIVKWFGTLTDIQSQKEIEEYLIFKNEELKQVNNDLDAFIYTASHDLKAPISNIEGLINTLKSMLTETSNLSDEVNQILTMQETSINRFKKVLVDLSDITQAQKSKKEEAEEIFFKDVLEEIEVSIENIIKSSHAEINADFSQCPRIRFTEKNLRSVLFNLISNAIKFHYPNKKPIVNITTCKDDQYIILKVQDNGIGIPDNKIEKVFTMFKKLHSVAEGTGIGLYIVKRIVTNAGGKVEVKSEQGKGSTFIVYFKRFP